VVPVAATPAPFRNERREMASESSGRDFLRFDMRPPKSPSTFYLAWWRSFPRVQVCVERQDPETPIDSICEVRAWKAEVLVHRLTRISDEWFRFGLL